MLITLLHFTIAFTASVIGAISGIGGGILIKPVLDAVGIFDIATINFLSGCTVLSMTSASLFRNRKSDISINARIGGRLAASGIAGGFLGKYLFNILLRSADNPVDVQTVQAAILLDLTAGVLIFTLFKRRVKPLHLTNSIFCIITGFILGLTGAFLGIGGGPINLLVLYFFFSMDSKTAAINSLFIIFFSQISSLLFAVFTGSVPEFSMLVLALMVFGGITGGLSGSAFVKKLSHEGIDRLFIIVLFIIILICGRNILF